MSEEKVQEEICFVICPIGDENSETRRKSDQMFRHLITPVVESHGYNALRGDEIGEPGMITFQIMQHVIEDSLVVADLTDLNPNVFYELAVRHATRKPIIHLIGKGEQIPFDVAGFRAIRYDLNDLGSIRDCEKELHSQVSSVKQEKLAIETPISQAIDMSSMRESGDPAEKHHAELMHYLQSILARVHALEQSQEARTSGGSDYMTPVATTGMQALLSQLGRLRTYTQGEPGEEPTEDAGNS